MRHAMLQELVVNVLAVSGEYRATADQAANDGEHGFKDRQTEGDDRNGDCDYG